MNNKTNFNYDIKFNSIFCDYFCQGHRRKKWSLFTRKLCEKNKTLSYLWDRVGRHSNHHSFWNLWCS